MNPQQEMIKLYAKQLKLPTLSNVHDLIRQAEENGLGYAEFLGEVLQREIQRREENQQKRRVRQARFSFFFKIWPLYPAIPGQAIPSAFGQFGSVKT